MDQPPKFTRHVWLQLWRLIRPYFFGRTWGRAWLQLGALITLWPDAREQRRLALRYQGAEAPAGP